MLIIVFEIQYFCSYNVNRSQDLRFSEMKTHHSYIDRHYKRK